jgi:glycosyltransferase involved in cell wall biosynthesis
VLLDDALAQLLADSHVLVVPSTYEGFGIVYLEGMGFGLPAIATTAGAAHEIITDGQDGYLVLPNDPEALAARLRRLHADRALLAQLGRNALQRYAVHPTWADSMARIRGFLQTFTPGATGKK